jgi:SlyX protein
MTNEELLIQLSERLEQLESKVAFQDFTIDQLNDEITQLNANNALLKQQLSLLVEKFKEQKGTQVAHESEETPPPHY